MKTKTIPLIILLCVIVTACKWPECVNKNPIFDQHDPSSEIYREALIEKIQELGQDDFGYWFDSYVEEDGKEYIWVKMQTHGLCAKAKMRVLNWYKIENIKENKGKGYSNAQLIGLRFEIKRDSLNSELVYESILFTVD